MPMTFRPIDQLCIDTLRTLAIDGVQRANSGHPGAPLGAAPMAYTLWKYFLKISPQDPKWMGRDRFVLSAGHASMLLYGLLHLTGFLTLEDLKGFRQWQSKTPGHPEYGHTPGVEMTTGPLGQGAATSVGMALGEAHLAARYNRPGFSLFDNHTYALVSDGDLQEGISHEAASLAGHLKLGKLIWLYDDNDIQLDSATQAACSDQVTDRFTAYGWQVLEVSDGNSVQDIHTALQVAHTETQKPTLIRVKTVIGYGSPRAGTPKAHGEPLGSEGVQATKAAFHWEHEEFHVPNEVYANLEEAVSTGNQAAQQWHALFERYRQDHPHEHAEVESILNGHMGELESKLPHFETGSLVATRDASQVTLNALAPHLASLLGGSADLSSSTKTQIAGHKPLTPDCYEGRQILFGVREFGMSACALGLSLYAGLRPFVGTFMVFSDYLKPSIRLAALMNQPVIYVLTHDSIGLGEDGPTHQPIEQLAALRSIPNLTVFRPADAHETAAAWQMALEHRHGPTALVLSRQKLKVLPAQHAQVRYGAYVVRDSQNPNLILIATGSEVSLALDVAEELTEWNVRVVSMPSMEVFRGQSEAYKKEVLPPHVPRVAIEAASPFGWHEWVGSNGHIVAIEGFGASAPAEVLFEQFGFGVQSIAQRIRKWFAVSMGQ